MAALDIFYEFHYCMTVWKLRIQYRRTKDKRGNTMKDLSGKTAIVTGGAQGIGKATAEYLSLHGAYVFLADVKKKEAEEACEEIRGQGCEVKAMEVDVSSVDSVEKMVGTVLNERSSIDILVNNAGIFSNTPIHDMTMKGWERVININLTGTHICSQAVIKHMIPRRSGKIVNLSSMAMQNGGQRAGADYAASKGGIAALTKSYAMYAAKYNITVNAVAPGHILTAMTAAWTTLEGAGDIIPMKRVGVPEDVAKVIYFLCSPLSDYVTGQTISINGGMILV